MLRKALFICLLGCTLAFADAPVPAGEFNWPKTPAPVKVGARPLDVEWKDGRPFAQRADLVRILKIPQDGEASVDLIEALSSRGWVASLNEMSEIVLQSSAPKSTTTVQPTTGAAPSWGGGGGSGLLMRVRQMLTAGAGTVRTRQCGGGSVDFEDVPPGGGLLRGIVAGYGDFMGNPVIHSIQPLYLTADGPVGGIIHGRASGGKFAGKLVRSEAKEGYAVGAIMIRAGAGLDGVQLTFMKIEDGGLNPNDSYTADLVGGHGGGENHFAGDGSLIVGIFGKTNKENQVNGLGVITLPAKPTKPRK